MSVNILGILIASYLVYDDVPTIYLLILICISIIMALTRMSTTKTILKMTDSSYDNKYIKISMLVQFSNALIYATITYLAIMYETNIINIFILYILIISLVAGAVNTIGAIFPVFFTFAGTSLMLLMFNFTTLDIESINELLLLLCIFSIFFLYSGYNNNRLLISYILLEEQQIKSSNNLKQLNDTLESRIQEEVLINRKKDQQLVQQSRLAQMGEMISMIAHQWRQPLAAISSTAISLNVKAQMNTIDKDIIMEQSDKISLYSQHLSSTIDDFREFFKPNKTLQNIILTDVIKDVLNIIETSVENKNISIIKDFKCQDIISTYPNELKQVILNLIKNAEDILIETGQKEPYIKISTYKENGNFVLEVSDNGGGIPNAVISKIFDPYFSTKIKKDGTGIGLYMSKTIIEDHCGGIISAKNNKDGAIFRIDLKS